MEELLERMRDRVLRHAPGPDGVTAIPNLFLTVLAHKTIPTMVLCDPMICVVVQGLKQVLIGGSAMQFRAGNCFTSTIELPATGCVLEADAERPYIAVGLTLDQTALASIVGDAAPELTGKSHSNGFGVERVTAEFLEAMDHLLALLDTPEDIPVLSSGREREVLYRLLRSGHGTMLRRAIRQGDGFSNIRRSVTWIRQNLTEKIRTETLAEIAGMSVPSFHRHFKTMTSLSPLQYQKTLRLQAARRLLVTSADTTQAAFAVGYESASQFSREYSRLFGIPPSKDAARMRAAPDQPNGYVI